MALFNSRKVKRLMDNNDWLHDKNDWLRNDIIRLAEQKSELDLKLFNTYGEEMVRLISKELGLSELQVAKLRLIFSIEHCRICGVSEERIIHNANELAKFFEIGEV